MNEPEKKEMIEFLLKEINGLNYAEKQYLKNKGTASFFEIRLSKIRKWRKFFGFGLILLVIFLGIYLAYLFHVLSSCKISPFSFGVNTFTLLFLFVAWLFQYFERKKAEFVYEIIDKFLNLEK